MVYNINGQSAVSLPPSLPAGALPQRVGFHQHVYQPEPLRGWQWQHRAIRKINSWQVGLEEKIPNFPIQKKIDRLGAEIEAVFSPLVQFNNWLNKNDLGSWYKQLAFFLIKLPIKAARNIIQQLYSIVRGILWGLIHPLQAINSVAKFLVMLPYEFVQPEMWSKMGAAIVGASLGEAAAVNGFASLIALGIGGALIVGGVTAGTLKALVEAEKGQKLQGAKHYLLKQAQELPETLLTSFFLGLIVAGIRRSIEVNKQPKKGVEGPKKPEEPTLPGYEEAKKFADTYTKEHNLPPYSRIELNSSNMYEIVWDQDLRSSFPQLDLAKYPPTSTTVTRPIDRSEWATLLKDGSNWGFNIVGGEFHNVNVAHRTSLLADVAPSQLKITNVTRLLITDGVNCHESWDSWEGGYTYHCDLIHRYEITTEEITAPMSILR